MGDKNNQVERFPMWARWGTGWMLALLLSTQIANSLLPGAFRVMLAFGALLSFPGFLTAELLDVRQRWSRVQVLVLGIALGIGEATILSRIATALRLQPSFIALIIVLLAAAKLNILRRRTIKPGRIRRPVDMKLMVQLGILMAIVAWFVTNTLDSPDRINDIKTDYWIYLGVQTQFSENGTDPNMQVGVFTTGTNMRLLWNPWHYVLSMLMDITSIHPVDFQSRDVILVLHIVAILAYIALARELLEHREAAYFSAILQVGLLTANSLGPAIYAQRIVEDKFFSLFVFIPITFLMVVRILDKPSRQDWLIAGVILLSATLIHPFNAIAINLTLFGYIVLRAMIIRKSLPMRRVVLLLGGILLLLLIPVIERVILTQYDLVREGLSRGVSGITLAYQVENRFWDSALASSIFVMYLFILLLTASRSTVDRGALFVTVISAAIFVGLWVPPFAAILAWAITESMNWRLFMLMPIGIGWGWLFLQGGRWLKRILPVRIPKPAITLLGLMPFVIHYVIWIGFPYRGYFDDEYRTNFWYRRTFTDAYWQVLTEGEEVVGNGTVGVEADLSRRVPTFWPDAKLIYYLGAPGYYRLEDRPRAYHDLQSLLYLVRGTDPAQILSKYDFDYLVTKKSMPLDYLINQEWPCCIRVYENSDYAIYEVRYSITRDESSEHEIETTLDVQIDDIVRLRGYRLEEIREGWLVTLFWEPLTTSQESLSVFVHMLGDINPATNTPIWSQDDHLPRLGQLDTTSWTTGALWADAYLLETQELPPGDYRISIGMYNFTTGVRLPVFDATGQLLGDHISLTEIHLE